MPENKKIELKSKIIIRIFTNNESIINKKAFN